MKYPKHPRKKWDTGERVEFKGGRRMQLPPHHHLNPPETIELPPNWHNMGRWALAGLRHYINDKGGLRKKLNASERRSMVALLATACACAFYVHDIGTELVELVKPPIADPEWPDAEVDEIAEHAARMFLNSAGQWKAIRESIAVAQFSEQWGVVSNAFSSAVQ